MWQASLHSFGQSQKDGLLIISGDFLRVSICRQIIFSMNVNCEKFFTSSTNKQRSSTESERQQTGDNELTDAKGEISTC
jgi:hypothetical protein